MVRILFVFVVLIAFGCTPAKINTSSGRPEVLVRCSDMALIRADVINRMLDNRYIIQHESETYMVFRRKAEGLGGLLADITATAANNPNNLISNYFEVQYVFVASGSYTRVVASLMRTEIDSHGVERSKPTTIESQLSKYQNEVMLPMQQRIEQVCK